MLYYAPWNLITVMMAVVWGLFLFTLYLIIFHGEWKSNSSK